MSGVFGLVGPSYPSRSASVAHVPTAFERPYEAARREGVHGNWRPGLRSADADWLDDRDEVIAKSRDIGRNEGVGASATMRVVNSSVGFRWDFTSKPNHRALGISYEAARELGQAIGAEWEQYAYGIHFCADAERTLTFGQLLRLSAAHIFNDGEMLGLVEWAEEELTKYKTRLRVVDPDRLSAPATASAGGVITLAVEPPVPTLVPGSAVADLAKPQAVFRQVIVESGMGELDALHSAPGTLSAIQDLRA